LYPFQGRPDAVTVRQLSSEVTGRGGRGGERLLRSRPGQAGPADRAGLAGQRDDVQASARDPIGRTRLTWDDRLENHPGAGQPVEVLERSGAEHDGGADEDAPGQMPPDRTYCCAVLQ
jgi:hypothetical protein